MSRSRSGVFSHVVVSESALSFDPWALPVAPLPSAAESALLTCIRDLRARAEALWRSGDIASSRQVFDRVLRLEAQLLTLRGAA